MKQGLYFIAILPPNDIAVRVQHIKKEFADRYNSEEAYKRPAHFTLQAPFKMPEKEEEAIISKLEFFTKDQQPFPVTLAGFNHFRNQVIYIDVEDSSDMKSLRRNLIDYLLDGVGFTDKMIGRKSLTPHMTVAYRDLSARHFEQAWEEFSTRSFDYSFDVNSIFLLKHDYKQWQPFHEFHFSEK